MWTGGTGVLPGGVPVRMDGVEWDQEKLVQGCDREEGCGCDSREAMVGRDTWRCATVTSEGVCNWGWWGYEEGELGLVAG